MIAQSFQPVTGVTATDSAIAHIRQQIRNRESAIGFRLGIRKSGCSGFKYAVDLVETPGPEDSEFPLAEGVTIYVDRASLPVVNGTCIDFVEEGLNRVFRFNNPNSAASCGCGESFSVRDADGS